ncbi:hypothetical protein BC6307_21405 [Sutcliffiella cohnii]|uniref:NAD-dependent epimerase/dehydratase domain-containing protein n=1 Tax=Sutcliffiella cohnii TaxID=33932 RepID=A0A223KWG6_9BACI|nr:NAD(P)-dependent oxidoreductase [Sutcliffiella cohnii]AST93638.1 hypothetical protein BC6307_21405 [Sutcliffiella cohnii]
MSYILVTGCNGFIGNKLTNVLLEKGYKVLGISSSPKTTIKNKNFQYISLDLTDCINIEKVFSEYSISTVIHLAGIAHVKKGKKVDWNSHYRINTLASHTVFKNAVKSNADVLFASTVDVYGTEKNNQFNEECTPKPTSSYGKSKVLAENHLKKLAKGSDSNYLIARIAPVYDKNFMNDAYKRIYLKFPTIAFTVGKGLDYQLVSINNVIEFIIKWVQSNKEVLGIVNVCDNQLVNSVDFIKLEKAEGRAKKSFQISKSFFNLVELFLNTIINLTGNTWVLKFRANLYKLINPPRYSTKRMEKLFTPIWNINNTVYKSKSKKN